MIFLKPSSKSVLLRDQKVVLMGNAIQEKISLHGKAPIDSTSMDFGG
jgi:hypothetical protein